LHYQLLGTLRIIKPDHHVVPTLPRQVQVLLTILLMQANQTISSSGLIDQLWNENPPRRADAAMHVYVSQLRKHLAHEGDQPVLTKKPGYQITLHTDELDLYVFRKLMQQARKSLRAKKYDEAGRTLGEALGMWRGPVLPDLQENATVRAHTVWLEELRAECTEMFMETQIMLGRARHTIGMLRDLTRLHPLHEAYHRQLITALYATDRRAEALQAYESARRVITTELGVEPCKALRELYHRILRDEEDNRLLNVHKGFLAEDDRHWQIDRYSLG
jgi:DNA-binding SARP family transcriptional activator